MNAPRIGWLSGSGRVLFAIALAASCAPDRADQSLPLPATTVADNDSLALELIAPPDIAAGDTVTVVLRVTNRSGRTLDLSLAGREIIYDLIVRDAEQRIVWRRLAAQTVQSILRLERISAQGVLEVRGQWSSAGRAPGRYSISGEMPTDAEPLRFGPVPIELR